MFQQDWVRLDSEVASVLLQQALRSEEQADFPAVDVEGHAQKLPFYAHWQLVVLHVRFRREGVGPQGGDLYGLARTDGSFWHTLDGSSGAIHSVNEAESLRLTKETVVAYLRFFCFAVRGDEGPFFLLEERPESVPGGAEAGAGLAQPVAATDPDVRGNFLLQAVVVYAGHAFRSSFLVESHGFVTMVDDAPVLADIPPSILPALPPLANAASLRALLDGEALPPQRQASPVPATEQRGRTALREMVELLLESSVRGVGEHRLIQHFNATAPEGAPLQRFAGLMRDASLVVVVETDLPFVEETIAEILCSMNGQTPLVCRADYHGEETPISFNLPRKGPAIVLLPLQVYRRVAQIERVAFDISANDLGAIITCERFAQLPESLRRISDVVLRLPVLDGSMFGKLFQRVLGHEAPAGWDAGGTGWVKHVLHTDFEHPRRMKLGSTAALDFVRGQVRDRLGAVDAAGGLGLAQLHGLGEARQFAEDLIADIHAALSGSLPWTQVDRGALLVGPPGTGKTTLARAIAKDCGVRFIVASPTGWQAEGGSLGPHIAAIRHTFAEARRYAPTILFIDEIDSIGNREEFTGSNAIYQTEIVNALLEQMQSLDAAAPVFVLAATNLEARVDPALRRAGRLDRVIRIPRPNSESLERIYQHYLRVNGTGVVPAPDLDLRVLGRLSVGLTGADVERVVRGAIRRARRGDRALSQDDLIAEVTNKPRHAELALRMTPADLERTAVHEAGHALAHYLGSSGGAAIGFVTIIPRDDGTLGFVAALPDDRVHLTRRDYEERLDVLLAGRAAEVLVYGEDAVSTGSSSDLRAATLHVEQMVTKLGLGGNGNLLWSDSMSADHVQLAQEALRTAHERILERLRGERARLDRLVRALVERQELSGDEVRGILAASRV